MMYGIRAASLCCLASAALALPSAGFGAEPGNSATTPAFVAGLAPQQRPAGAPVIREFAGGADWRKLALTGISAPVPTSLKFLDSQGAWYTPFDRPGIPGYYDLRRWHTAAARSHTTSARP